MNLSKTTGLLFFQLISLVSFSSSGDSLPFIDNVRNFAFKTTEYYPDLGFFTRWTSEEKPYLYLYVSYSDSVKKPKEFIYPYFFCGTDEIKAGKEELKLKASGYNTFCYKTYANSTALLNKRLVSYSNEAIVFIVFHELIHNYLGHKSIKIPYEFIEALCDVIGNYGALEYSISTDKLDSISAKSQIEINEKIYDCFNDAILKINQNPSKTSIINADCQETIGSILTKANSFQKDRFDFKVNTAYLLKNGYYCKHYFLLKKVLLKQKSIKALLEIIKGVPENSSECELYLMKFT